MKKNVGVIILIVVITALVFALSSTGFESVDKLMRPPKNKGQNSEIQTAFETSVNDKYILRSPLSGEYKSSFILVDFDSDKNDEVIVFYSLSSSPDVARMNVLDSVDGIWRSIADFESAHKQIHKVDFSDIDKDGVREIIVGWSLSDTELTNTLNVYKLKSVSDSIYAEKIFENNYTEFAVCDINSDFKSDILLFDKFRADTTSIRATYFDFGDYGARTAGEFFIDPIISSVYSVCYDKDKSNGNTRFYIDGYRLDNGMTTELFYWDKKENRFRNPNYNDFSSISTLATRNTAITCKDINDDGIIEIPFEEYISESEVVLSAKSLEKQQSIIQWMKYNDYGLTSVYHEIFIQNKYSLKIKNEWVGNFTVKNEPDEGLLTFYSVNSLSSDINDDYDRSDDIFDFHFDNNIRENENDKALFSILSVAENESNIYDLTGFKFLKNDNGFDYFYCIYREGKKWDITKDSLKKILITRGVEK